MDGVIADLEAGILKVLNIEYPEICHIPLDKRTTFYAADQYQIEYRPIIKNILLRENFYSSLLPIEGSIKALNELRERGENVFICSSPKSNNPFCIQEKCDWVMRHLGKDWKKMLIFSKDKTIIHGDILIDDKPEIKGVKDPSWEHIIFSQPYNAKVASKRRINWQNWKTILFD